MNLVDRDASVLVVVDAQPGFLAKPTGTRGPEARSALDRMTWLVALAAELRIPIVVTEEEPERHGPTAEELASFLPSGTTAFRKPTFGLAASPDILAAVQAHGRQTAVLVGCETDVCVAQSAIGLLAHGLACVAVGDATFSPGEMHARGLERMRYAGVALNHAKGLTYEWLRSVEDAHAVLASPALPPAPFVL